MRDAFRSLRSRPVGWRKRHQSRNGKTQIELPLRRPPRGAAAEGSTIRPFQFSFPDEDLVELRRRIDATRWPERETVDDDSQGVPLATMQELARYWATEHDWRRCEAKLNALPQFTTEIDGLDIHFLHVRSQHPDALPLIVTHGWPGSIIGIEIRALPIRRRTAATMQTRSIGLPSLRSRGSRHLSTAVTQFDARAWSS